MSLQENAQTEQVDTELEEEKEESDLPEYVVLTQEMLDYLECSITEIGVSERNAAAIEETCGVICLADLMKLNWDRLAVIPNFGVEGIKEIRNCIVKHGFVIGRNVQYVDYRDADRFFAQQKREFGDKAT